MRWIFGFALILIGVLYLGQTLAWWGAIDFNALWQFWPILLILVGLAIMVKRWRFGWIVMVLAIASTLGVVFYGGLTHEKFLTVNDTVVKKNNISEELPQNINRANIEIDSGGIIMNLSGSTDKLMEGNLDSNISEPMIKKFTQGDVVQTFLSIDRKTLWQFADNQNNLDLKLTNKIPVDLTVNSGGSKMNIDLSEIQLGDLTINGGASSLDLRIGNSLQDNSNITISAGASEIKMEIPKDLGARVFLGSSPLMNKNIEGFTKVDNNEYQSENYDAASKHISVTVNAGVSSLDVTRY